METPQISIIIPVYKSEATLVRCIESVLAQTYRNIEVVIVDDGTPDRGGEIADEYAARYANVTAVHQSNAGLAEARRSGIRAATGDYVIHLDSDDELLPDAAEFLYGKAAENDLDIVYGCYVRVAEDATESVTRHPVEGEMSSTEFLHYLLDPPCICASWGCISRRSIWHDDVWPPHDFKYPGEDVYINIKLTAHITRAGIYNVPVCRYYFVATSLSNTGVLSRQEAWERYFADINAHLRQRGLYDECERQMQTLIVNRLAFLVNRIDTSNQWVKQVINAPKQGLPRKTRLLMTLLHTPRLCRAFVKTNRAIKRIKSKLR